MPKYVRKICITDTDRQNVYVAGDIIDVYHGYNKQATGRLIDVSTGRLIDVSTDYVRLDCSKEYSYAIQAIKIADISSIKLVEFAKEVAADVAADADETPLPWDDLD